MEQEVIKTGNNNVFAVGNEIKMHVNSNFVIVNDMGIVFPFEDKKEYILTVSIKPINNG